MQAYRQFIQDKQSIDITKIALNIDKSQPQEIIDHSKTQQQFQEFKHIYLTSYLLSSQKDRLEDSVQSLVEVIENVQNTLVSRQSSVQQLSSSRGDFRQHNDDKSGDINRLVDQKSKYSQDKIKRTRRKADSIVRKWQCKEQCCGKTYGAHASLLQHVKFKHPQVYQNYI